MTLEASPRGFFFRGAQAVRRRKITRFSQAKLGVWLISSQTASRSLTLRAESTARVRMAQNTAVRPVDATTAIVAAASRAIRPPRRRSSDRVHLRRSCRKCAGCGRDPA